MATLSVGGTTVFDGSALQSGVTGDVSGVTIFPAGHVLQCVAFNTSNQGNITNNNNTLLMSPSIQMTLCPLKTGSNVLIQVQWMGEDEEPQNSVYNVLREEGTVTASSARVNAPGSAEWQGLTVPGITYDMNWGSTPEAISLVTMDKTGTTAGTDVQYALARSTYINNMAYTNRTLGHAGQNGEEHCSSSMILTEIMV